MKKFTLTTIVFCFFYSLSAQEDITNLTLSIDTGKKVIYKTWISLNNGQNTIKGALYEVNDSSILVSNSFRKNDYSTGKFNVTTINFNNINLVKIRQNNSLRKGALIGSITGFVVGALIGLISGDDPPGFLSFSAGEKALMYGFPMAIGGTGLGELVGSIRIRIPINGSIKIFHENNSRLKNYSYRKSKN